MNTKITHSWDVLSDRELSRFIFISVIEGKPEDAHVERFVEDSNEILFEKIGCEMVFSQDHCVVSTSEKPTIYRLVSRRPLNLVLKYKKRKKKLTNTKELDRLYQESSKRHIELMSVYNDSSEQHQHTMKLYDELSKDHKTIMKLYKENISLLKETTELMVTNKRHKEHISQYKDLVEKLRNDISNLRKMKGFEEPLSYWVDMHGNMFPVGFGMHNVEARKIMRDIYDETGDDRYEVDGHYTHHYERLQDLGWVRILGWAKEFVMPKKPTVRQINIIKNYCQKYGIVYPEFLR